MHEVLVNRLGGLSLPRKSVVRLTDRPDMTLDVYRGRKTTIQHNIEPKFKDIATFFSTDYFEADVDRSTYFMRRHQGANVKHFNVSNVIYHKFSHGAVFYTLNGENVNVMLLLLHCYFTSTVNI